VSLKAWLCVVDFWGFFCAFFSGDEDELPNLDLAFFMTVDRRDEEDDFELLVLLLLSFMADIVS